MTRKIAIIGISFRFPGTNPDEYWTDLIGGKDMVTSVDPSRWALDTFRHPRKSHPGTSYTFAAGTLGDVSGFDASFFGISPREAGQMDPQQRLLLELTWEAFEGAGIKPSTVRGSRTGVYIGISSADYAYRFADDLGAVDSTVATGNTTSIAANRISYVFDLRGPSMAIDTACSSSMVAFHQACQSILAGESNLAIAGGVSLHLHPYGFIAFSKASMLSKRGKCRVFDADGDGYVRSEGGGILLLKEYDKAVADGDRILALVAGTGINSDGRKSGLTVPSSEAQAGLLRDVYGNAGIAPEEIDYIEAHGTGTAVGDPIETHALGAAIGRHRAAGNPLLIGSVKSNMGHLEAASGVAGLVKAIHCIQYRTVPATIHLDRPNPNIQFEAWNLHPVTKPVALRPTGRIVVGVNSFGFGGANAHAILESAPGEVSTIDKKAGKAVTNTLVPLVLSGKSPEALKRVAGDFAKRLSGRASLYDMAYAAAFHREWHTHRAVIFAATNASAVASLQRFSQGQHSPGDVDSGEEVSASAKVAFIYSGNGAQWEGMGRQLMAESDLFRDAVRRVDELFQPLGGFSIEDEFNGKNGSGRYAHTDVAQPTLFAFQVGITEMLRSYGLRADAVAGHSVGEVAAAWAAGALSLEQGVSVIFHRSRLQETTRGDGEMLAAAISHLDFGRMVEDLPAGVQLSLAAINSPRGITVAGSSESLAFLESRLKADGKVFKRLDLPYAFHSSKMDCIESGVYKALATLRPRSGTTPYYSTVTGDQLGGTFLDAFYWWQNIRNPVRFHEVVGRISSSAPHLFIEVGPHAVLRGYINESLKASKQAGSAMAASMRGDESISRVRSTVAQALIGGVEPEWTRLFPNRGKAVRLPTYPWQRESFWHESTAESLNLLGREPRHPLLGAPTPGHETSWESLCDTHLQPFLADHVVGEAIVFPGAAHVELAISAFAAWHHSPDGSIVEIEDLEIRSPLLLDSDHTKQIRVQIDPADGSLSICSRTQFSGESWHQNAAARLPKSPFDRLGCVETGAFPQRAYDFEFEAHQRLTSRVGLQYGPSFQSLRGGWIDAESEVVIGHLRPPEEILHSLPDYRLHPALLDAAFQLLAHLVTPSTQWTADCAFVPTRIGRLQFRFGSGLPTHAKMRVAGKSPHSINCDFHLFDSNGMCVALLENARFRSVRLQRTGKDLLRHLEYVGIPMPLRREASQSGSGEPPAATIADHLKPAISQWAGQATESGALQVFRNEVEPLLDALCDNFADAALRISMGSPESAQPAQSELPLRFARDWLYDVEYSNAPGDELPTERALKETGTTRTMEREELPLPSDIYNALLADHPDHFAALNSVGQAGAWLQRAVVAPGSESHVGLSGCLQSSLKRLVLNLGAGPGLATALQPVFDAVIQRMPEGSRLGVLEIAQDQAFVAGRILAGLPPDRCDLYQVLVDPDQLIESRADEYNCADSVHVLPLQLAGTESSQIGRDLALALVCNDFDDQGVAATAYQLAIESLRPGGALVWIDFVPARWRQFVASCVTLLKGTHHPAPLSGSEGAGESVLDWIQQSLDQKTFSTSASFLLGPADQPVAYLHVAGKHAASMTQPLPAPSIRQEWVLICDGDSDAALASMLEKRLLAVGQSSTLCRSVGEAVELVRHKLSRSDSDGLLGGLVLLPSHAPPAIVGVEVSTDAVADWIRAQVQRCTSLCALARNLEMAASKLNCWVVTNGASGALLPSAKGRAPELSGAINAAARGFSRSLMNEPGALRWRTIDIESCEDRSQIAASIAAELTASTDETEVCYSRTGARFVPRLRYQEAGFVTTSGASAEADSRTEASCVRLGFSTPGQLRNLRWEQNECRTPDHDEIEIRVRATGLNFRDIMYSLGLLSDEAVEGGFAGATLGLECAGVVERVGQNVTEFKPGDRVVAFGPASFADRMVTKCIAASLVPEGLSFESAATIPSAFFTAYYALHHVARLAAGERVLIHGAAGGVGIAAIQLARHMGAEIFATAGSDDKRDFVRLLGADHVFDSRGLAFADEILLCTQGEGVDVVLNSLAGEAINRNLRVLRPFGRLLELGKRDFYENSKIGLRPFRNNIAFFGIDADQLMQCQPELTRRLFREMMGLFANGALHPLPYRTFEASDVVDAFRHMQQAKHIGKIVVTGYERLERIVPMAKKRTLSLPSDATWLVTGGLGGFGLKSAQWLAEKGVRNLVLIGRRGAATGEALNAITRLEAAGVRVKAAACDVSDARALEALLDEIRRDLPPLRGILHAAAVFDDALARNTAEQQICATFDPKVKGALHLHLLTRHLALDHFILYSSATTLFGNPGQASYVAANSVLESLAAVRRANGLPATCIAWGAIGDAGFLTRHADIKEQLVSRMGGSALSSETALAMLEEALLEGRPNAAIMELDWRAISRFLPSASDPKFSHMQVHAMEGGDDISSAEDIERMLAELNDQQLSAAFIEILRSEIGEILRLAPDRIDPERSVYEMGLDSLMGVELVMAIESRFGIRLPVMALSETPTVARLADKVIQQLRETHPSADSAGEDVARQVQQAVSQHAPDVDTQEVEKFVVDISRGSAAHTGRMIH